LGGGDDCRASGDGFGLRQIRHRIQGNRRKNRPRDAGSSIGSTIGFGAVADLGKITPDINLEGEFFYWSKGYTSGYYDWSYSQIYLTAIAKYFFAQKKGAKWLPYAGGGLGLVFGKVKSDWKGADIYGIHGASTSASNTDLGIHLLGGVKTKLSPTVDGFAQAEYVIDGADFFGLMVGAIVRIN